MLCKWILCRKSEFYVVMEDIFMHVTVYADFYACQRQHLLEQFILVFTSQLRISSTLLIFMLMNFYVSGIIFSCKMELLNL